MSRLLATVLAGLVAACSGPPGSDVAAGDASPRGDGLAPVRTAEVVDVVDGDTVVLADGTRVRLAITDAPEVREPLETCGPEATERTTDLVAGQRVALYRPPDAPATDPFGRTLAEVVRVVDGTSVNVALAASGLARVDERFSDEDPDLAARLRVAAGDATAPDCVPR